MKLRTHQRGIARIYILGGVLLAGTIFFIIGSIINSDRGLGTGAEYTPPDGPAIMNESEDLYRLLDDNAQFDFLKQDLAVFGRTTIEKYKSGKEPAVVFIVNKGAKKDGDRVNFEGKFAESKDTIAVGLTKRAHGRISVSITNKKTSASVDSQLPSNSKRNQYIGSLPIKKETFTVNFTPSNDAFLVTLQGTSVDSAQIAAIEELKAALSLPDLSDENVSFLAWGPNGLPMSLPNPDALGD